MAKRMNRTGNTRVSERLCAYPGLKEKLPDTNRKGKMLKAAGSDKGKRCGTAEQFIIEHLDSLRCK